MKKFLFVLLATSCLTQVCSAEDFSAGRMISIPTAISENGGISGAAHLHSFFGFAYSLGGMIRYTHSIAENVSLGVGSNIGVLLTPAANVQPVFFGAGPMISFGDQKFSATVGAFYYGATAKDKVASILLPSAGFSTKLNNVLRLNAELIIPVTKERYDSITRGLIMYGFRFGSRVYGGVDFILPFGGDSTIIYKVFPIGIPIFSLGVGF